MGAYWYTTCGVPLPNQAEMITIVSILTLLATVVFTNLHFKSYGDNVFHETSAGVKKKIKRN